MKKNKTSLFIGLALIFIIAFSIFISSMTGKEEIKFNNVSYQEYEKYYGENKDKLVFVYVGRPGCTYCVQIQPLLGQIQEEEKIVFNYLNTDTMSQDDINNLPKTAKAFEGKWGTPTLVAIVNGKEHSSLNGYSEIESIREFVKTAKSASENE